MNSIHRALSIACLCTLLALGCASSRQSTEPTPEIEPTPVADTDTDTDVGGALALSEPDAPALDPVYFDTDRTALRPEARETLKRYARQIQQHPEWGVVTVEGHCDERGSEEYNLALGGKRAATVARYLTDQGVPSGRLETRTYGEARPAALGHSEVAWSQNRRAEIESETGHLARR